MNEYIGRLRMPDPTLPLPNDDPRCECEVGFEGPVPPGVFVMAGTVCGRPVNLALREDCVHHRRTVDLIRHGTVGGFSVGVHFPPAKRREST